MTTPTTVNIRLQLRADTAANWTAANPTLLANEVGLETDTKKLKVGNGSTAWNSLAYFPSIVSGGTVLGNLEIGSTGTLTFEGSTADGFETTLAVTNPTADRTITLPNQSGTVIVSGNASIVDADIAANAEIAVSKLANGTANQVLVTDGTDVSWSDNLTLAGDLTVNGTTTTVNSETLLVKDKNIEMGVVDTPTDITADGGGITLKGATDKTINWIDATDAWTSSERFSVPLGSNTAPSLTFTGDENTGLYSPGQDQVAVATNGTQRLRIDANGKVGVGTMSTVRTTLHVLDETTTNTVANAAIFSGGTATTLGAGAKIFLTGYNSENRAAYLGAENVSGTSGAHDFTIGTSATGSAPTERLRVTSAGLVGIGVSGPEELLHLGSSQSGDAVELRIDNSSTGANSITSLKFYSASGSAASTRARAIIYGMGEGNNDGQLVFHNRKSGTVSESARIDEAGRLLIGTSTARSNVDYYYGSSSPQLQLEQNSGGPGLSVLHNWSSGTNEVPGLLSLGRSGASTIGSNAIVANNNWLGAIDFLGSDGSNFTRGASIHAAVDGTPGANDMPGRLVFSTTADGASSPTERMRVTSGGKILYNTTSPSAANTAVTIRAFDNSVGGSGLDIVNWGSGRGHAIALTAHNTGNADAMYFSTSAALVGSISITSTSTAYNTSSDYRLKQNIAPVTDGITRLQQLKPSRFNFLADPGKVVDGFIAHEVQLIVPEAVTGTKDETGPDGNPKYQGIDQSKLVPLLTAALQEAIGEIESLKARVAALETA